MKVLTSITVIMAIPTIISGFYGMNVDLPVIHSPFDWVIITVLMIVLMVWLVVLMRKHHFF